MVFLHSFFSSRAQCHGEWLHADLFRAHTCALSLSGLCTREKVRVCARLLYWLLVLEWEQKRQHETRFQWLNVTSLLVFYFGVLSPVIINTAFLIREKITCNGMTDKPQWSTIEPLLIDYDRKKSTMLCSAYFLFFRAVFFLFYDSILPFFPWLTLRMGVAGVGGEPFKVLRKLAEKENKTKCLVNLRVDEHRFSFSVASSPLGARTKKAVLHIIERCHSAPRASQAEEAADFWMSAGEHEWTAQGRRPCWSAGKQGQDQPWWLGTKHTQRSREHRIGSHPLANPAAILNLCPRDSKHTL